MKKSKIFPRLFSVKNRLQLQLKVFAKNIFFLATILFEKTRKKILENFRVTKDCALENEHFETKTRFLIVKGLLYGWHLVSE